MYVSEIKHSGKYIQIKKEHTVDSHHLKLDQNLNPIKKKTKHFDYMSTRIHCSLNAQS